MSTDFEFLHPPQWKFTALTRSFIASCPSFLEPLTSGLPNESFVSSQHSFRIKKNHKKGSFNKHYTKLLLLGYSTRLTFSRTGLSLFLSLTRWEDWYRVCFNSRKWSWPGRHKLYNFLDQEQEIPPKAFGMSFQRFSFNSIWNRVSGHRIQWRGVSRQDVNRLE